MGKDVPLGKFRTPQVSSTFVSVYVVVPAYNEHKSIRAVVESLMPYGTVVVVDDGSSDGTGIVAAEAGAIVPRHPINLGQGAALQTGMEYSLQNGAQYIVTFDADGQHDPNDIPRLLSILKDSNVDLILGSRFLGSTIGMTASRRIMLLAARRFSNFSTGLKLTDVHNGFRILTRRAAEAIRLNQNRMAHASEFLTQIKQQKLSFLEGPVTIRYTEYSMAKGQRASAALGILLELLTGKLLRW